MRELKNHLSRYLARVQGGEEVVVTERGRPIARLVAVDQPTDRLADLVASGLVRPPQRTARRRPTKRITPTAPVSDLVADPRR